MGILSVKSLPIALHFSSNFKHSVFDMPVPISIYPYPKLYSLKPGTVWKPVKISFSTSDIPATDEAHWGPWTRVYGISSLSTAICGLLYPYVFSITSSNTHYFIGAFYLCLPSLLSEVLWKDYHFNFCKAIISINVIIKPIFFLTKQNIVLTTWIIIFWRQKRNMVFERKSNDFYLIFKKRIHLSSSMNKS